MGHSEVPEWATGSSVVVVVVYHPASILSCVVDLKLSFYGLRYLRKIAVDGAKDGLNVVSVYAYHDYLSLCLIVTDRASP